MVERKAAMLVRTVLQDYEVKRQYYSTFHNEGRPTMLNAVRAPLAFRYLTEDADALVQQFIDDTIFGQVFKILESMLCGYQKRKEDDGRGCIPERQVIQSHDTPAPPTCL